MGGKGEVEQLRRSAPGHPKQSPQTCDLRGDVPTQRGFHKDASIHSESVTESLHGQWRMKLRLVPRSVLPIPTADTRVPITGSSSVRCDQADHGSTANDWQQTAASIRIRTELNQQIRILFQHCGWQFRSQNRFGEEPQQITNS